MSPVKFKEPNHSIQLKELYLRKYSSQLSKLSSKSFDSTLTLMFRYYPQDATTEVGEPLIPHLLEAARIVNGLELYETSILATLLIYFPVYYPTSWREKLNTVEPEVLPLIEGFISVQTLTNFLKAAPLGISEEEKDKQTESMKKMLLAMVNDIRVVLIKLCLVTQTMRQLSHAPTSVNRLKVANETLSIFAPLANRLGIWQLKWELEDLAFQHQHPQEYKTIAQLLNERRIERLGYIQQFANLLKQALEKEGIHCGVAGRPKHIYSIYRKMKRKRLQFNELYDILAVRVLVETVAQCYNALGVVHSLWRPISGEFDDYISHPKPNDYRSLHTVIVGPENKSVEVQIRTFEMHRFAEFGVAAHWKYKEASKNDTAYEQKIAWLRQLLDWRENMVEADKSDLASAFKTELFKDTIYVLTPLGKVLSLPNGSTPIDFAYALHTDIGHRCRGAKVNGSIVPLSTPLENGQKVEIITSKVGNPSVNWLHEGWVKSPKAISKIRSFIRKQNTESTRECGRNYLEKALHKLDKRPSFQEIADQLHYPNLETLYFALGNGDVTNRQLQKTIHSLNTQLNSGPSNTKGPIVKSSKVKGVNDTGILINGEAGLLSVCAKCCKPVPPDPIIGFVTRGRGISIHRKSCQSFLNLAQLYPQKVVDAQWGGTVDQKTSLFSVDIEILAQDRNGLLKDLSDTFSRTKINVTDLQIRAKGSTAKMRFTVEVRQVSDLPNLLAQLGEIPDVFEVHRI
ncbi:MAG: bifunctional (p)ppGpp synthetase/guanosine-3',5'-bis(diphosphate) 3'-pyrophosphohydrolase [Neisseriaceae bacterium]